MASCMERFVATMVFCEAPFDGPLLAPAVPAAGHDSKSGGNGCCSELATFMAAAKETARQYLPSKQEQQQRQGGVDGLAEFLDAVVSE